MRQWIWSALALALLSGGYVRYRRVELASRQTTNVSSGASDRPILIDGYSGFVENHAPSGGSGAGASRLDQGAAAGASAGGQAPRPLSEALTPTTPSTPLGAAQTAGGGGGPPSEGDKGSPDSTPSLKSSAQWDARVGRHDPSGTTPPIGTAGTMPSTRPGVARDLASTDWAPIGSSPGGKGPASNGADAANDEAVLARNFAGIAATLQAKGGARIDSPFQYMGKNDAPNFKTYIDDLEFKDKARSAIHRLADKGLISPQTAAAKSEQLGSSIRSACRDEDPAACLQRLRETNRTGAALVKEERQARDEANGRYLASLQNKGPPVPAPSSSLPRSPVPMPYRPQSTPNPKHTPDAQLEGKYPGSNFASLIHNITNDLKSQNATLSSTEREWDRSLLKTTSASTVLDSELTPGTQEYNYGIKPIASTQICAKAPRSPRCKCKQNLDKKLADLMKQVGQDDLGLAEIGTVITALATMGKSTASYEKSLKIASEQCGETGAAFEPLVAHNKRYPHGSASQQVISSDFFFDRATGVQVPAKSVLLLKLSNDPPPIRRATIEAYFTSELAKANSPAQKQSMLAAREVVIEELNLFAQTPRLPWEQARAKALVYGEMIARCKMLSLPYAGFELMNLVVGRPDPECVLSEASSGQAAVSSCSKLDSTGAGTPFLDTTVNRMRMKALNMSLLHGRNNGLGAGNQKKAVTMKYNGVGSYLACNARDYHDGIGAAMNGLLADTKRNLPGFDYRLGMLARNFLTCTKEDEWGAYVRKVEGFLRPIAIRCEVEEAKIFQKFVSNKESSVPVLCARDPARMESSMLELFMPESRLNSNKECFLLVRDTKASAREEAQEKALGLSALEYGCDGINFYYHAYVSILTNRNSRVFPEGFDPNNCNLYKVHDLSRPGAKSLENHNN